MTSPPPWVQRPTPPLDLALLAGFVVIAIAILVLAYLYKNGG